jgi:imidazolonepropionase
MKKAELIIHSAAQLVTCAAPAKPKRGEAMREVGIIPDGAVAIAGGQILAVGTTAEILAEYTAEEKLDVGGKAVCPGFVDAHTHLVYGGDRVDEFELRIAGKSYLEIMAAGGGIQNTVLKTRAAGLEQLVSEATGRLNAMLQLGTTTAEVKTGYGLDTATELKMLQTIEQLAQAQPVELVPTFLGAHSLPPEYKANPDEYVRIVIEEMLPAVARWYNESYFAKKNIPCFIDVFCEQGVFNVAQTRRILSAGKAYGLAPKAHVDEFVALGGTTAGIELGAVSLDHLDQTPLDELDKLADSDSVAVIIPAVNFNLGSTHYAPARTMLDKGVALALATDINPGSAPCPSIPFVMAIASRYQRLLPAETLNAVTINAAHAIGMAERLGSLEAGKQADLLVLAVPDYRHLAYQFGGNLVQTVYKRGKMVTIQPPLDGGTRYR